MHFPLHQPDTSINDEVSLGESDVSVDLNAAISEEIGNVLGIRAVPVTSVEHLRPQHTEGISHIGTASSVADVADGC